tara:strand:+ start:64 stop:1905 length:1842 start_codon:yes stop_codon:yes gene_type:complete
MTPAEKLMRWLPPGLERAYGQYNPVSKEHHFINRPLTLQQYEDHITGIRSLGVVPIDENGEVSWAAIDIDTHKNDKTKPPVPWSNQQYKKLLDKIKFLKLPLTVVKSKGGGAHCILSLGKKYSAKAVQDLMKVFEYALGYEGLEVFPKQTELGPEDSGSFLNLPYFKGNSRNIINFDYKTLDIKGLDYALERIVKLPSQLKFFLLKQGSRTQHRNDRTWCAAAYFKKQYPDQWEEKTIEYNQLFNEPPLGEAHGEKSDRLESTVLKSHRKKPYNNGENADEFEQNTFNKKNNGKDHSAWRQGILAKDLEQEELKPIEWVVEGLIAPGLNLIAGKSKIGKSFGTLDLAYQVEVGGEWLEKKCSKGNVLYYSLEDGKRRCKNRWKAMGIKPQEAWYQFRDRKPRIPLLTMGLEEEIEDWIKNTPDRKLVVIDVYVKVKKTLGGYKLNSYENDNYNLQNLQTLATKYEIAIVLVHHITKRKEDDVFDEINGSTGIQSNMDSMIVISSDRTKGKNPILYCIPKDGEPQQFEIALSPKCIWENLGKPGMAALTKIQNAITKAMKDNSERTSKEIIVKVQVDNGKENWTDKHIQKEVTRLVEKSYLMKIKRGHYKQMPF